MLHVLVVDDRPAVTEGLRKLIPWNKLDADLIGEARNGKDALELAKTEKPDLIITDVKMPIMDGIELCREVQALLPQTKLIILTAYDDFAYARSAIQYGVTDYILKPIDRTKINQIIETISTIASDRAKRDRLNALLYSSTFLDSFIAVLKSGKDDEFLALFESAFTKCETSDLGIVKELCLKISITLFDSIESIGLSAAQMGMAKDTAIHELTRMKTSDDAKEHVRVLFLHAMRLIREKSGSRSEATVEQLKHYVHAHYMDPNLCIESIADVMELSANYTSVIFRQKTNEHLSAYITQVRMEQARRLLKDPRAAIAQISKQVGYNDSHYFAKVFKKATGLTPTHYRNLHFGDNG
ncbi:response regulator transcription factor [Paenibacillus silvisoli]|uniref:response regulator transcription factor n=1 Tax=Paenibacillus silvisoli TaxID=3110539 RepID=UPI0028059C06|nr:response regulator [Paenibacillus silvisoli]